MPKQSFDLAAELKEEGKPFALATVVRREPPISARPGDKAVITADGGFTGWVGGSCAKPTVMGEALKALRDGRPRLILLTPRPEEEKRSGVEVFPMTCHSGGTVEIYIEPYAPPPRLLVMGTSPIAEALSRLGSALGYRVTVMDPGATEEEFPKASQVLQDFHPLVSDKVSDTYVVVATMGHGDEEALQAAVACGAQYLGMIASRTKFDGLLHDLKRKGVAGDVLRKVKNPAGLDINAKLPGEVALSILAEIIQLRQSQHAELAPAAVATEVAALLTNDPICGMMVEKATAPHKVEHDEVMFYFCCAGCRRAFQENPDKYLARAEPVRT
jgi:xanthine dehydrogenase accessory factor